MRTLSDEGAEWIGGLEEFRSLSYLDQAGVWTIAFGCTRINDQPVTEGMEVNLAVGLALRRGDAAEAVAEVNRLISMPMTQSQFDALVSLTYNIGGGGLAGSTIRKEMNAGHPITEDMFTRWNKVTDPKTKQLVVSDGLTARRKREFARFIRGYVAP